GAGIDDTEANIAVTVFGTALEHGADVGDGLINLSHVGELRVENHAEIAIIRHLLHGFFRYGSGLRPLLRFAIGVDDFLVAAPGVFISKQEHLSEGLYGGRI